MTLLVVCLSLLAAPAPRQRGSDLPTRTGDGFSEASPIWPEYLCLASLHYKDGRDESRVREYADRPIYLFGSIITLIPKKHDDPDILVLGEVGVPVTNTCQIYCQFNNKAHAEKLKDLPDGGFATVKGHFMGWRRTSDGHMLECQALAIHKRSPWGDTWVHKDPKLSPKLEREKLKR